MNSQTSSFYISFQFESSWFKLKPSHTPNWLFLLILHSSYFEHWCFFLTDEHTDIWVTQVSAVNLLVPASGVNVREGFVDLQRPHAFIVHPVRSDAPLLAQRPQSDGPVRAPRQTLQRRTTASDLNIMYVAAAGHRSFKASQLTWVPSRFKSSDFTLSVWPFSFISFAHVRGSQTLRTWWKTDRLWNINTHPSTI